MCNTIILRRLSIKFWAVLFCGLLTVLSIEARPYQYLKLKFYVGKDCKFCKFSLKQVREMINSKGWDKIVEFQEQDCNIHIELCRDTLSEPLLIMEQRNSEGQSVQKLGELGGVQSKLYIQEWIEGFFDIYSAQLVQEKGKQESLTEQKIINKQNLLNKYYVMKEMEEIRLKNKFNILNTFEAENKKSKMNDFQIQRKRTFLSSREVKSLIFIAIIVVIVMYLINKSPHKRNQGIRIPSEDME